MAELIGGLWPEGRERQDLRVWTPDATALFKGLASQGPAAGETFSAIVEGRRALPLASLPAPLYQWLAAQLNRTARLHLWLSADLPAAWQRFPCEWLTLDGTIGCTLLRALAAWAWRRRDLAALARLKPYLPQLQTRLESRQDTGPIGFTLAYWHLCAGDELAALPPWETISVNLKAGRYFRNWRSSVGCWPGLGTKPGGGWTAISRNAGPSWNGCRPTGRTG